MQEEEKSVGLIESIEFIFRHPWLVISPFVIIMSVVFAQLETIPLMYKSSALITFETGSGQQIGTKGVGQSYGMSEQIDWLIKILLRGDGPDKIIEEGWPDLNKKTDAQKYNSLRIQITGVEMKYDPKNNLLNISSTSENAKLCYKIVQATSDGVGRYIRETTRRKLEVGLDFLKKQEEFYRKKIRSTDEAISKIKNELQNKAKDLTEEERILISEITGERDLDLRDRAAMQKMAKYDEMLAELQLLLLEAKKDKQFLEDNLRRGRFTTYLPGDELKEDSYLERYSKQIADKEMDIVNLTLQGYLSEHPQIKKLTREIDALKTLKQKRNEILRGEDGEFSEKSKGTKREAEERLRAEIEKTELEISTIEDKIDLIALRYQEISPRSMEETGFISEVASRLKELREEKKISQGYYQEIRRQLGEAELRSRVEEAEEGLKLIVVQKAEIPKRSIPFQKAPKIIWGLIISAFIGIGLAYAVESGDSSIRTASELRELLHTPILGSVDKISTIGEIRLNMVRRNAIIIGLVLFALAAKFLLNFSLFKLIFGFLK